MKAMRKLLSLLLVLSVLCSLALPAMAAETDFSLSTDKSSYNVGDTAYVTLTLNTTYTLANVGLRVWYDPTVFTYDASNSSLGEIMNGFALKNLTDPVETNYNTETNYTEKGWKPVNITAAYLGTDGSFAAGTVATLAFTVNAATESATFETQVRQLNTADAATDYKATATTSDVTVSAVATAYTVTVNAAENGTVTADKTTATAGETVTLTTTPADGYELDEITVTDASGAAVEVTSKTFVMPASNVTVSATFARPLTITAAGEACTVTEVAAYKYFVQIPENADITVADVFGSITTCYNSSWEDDDALFANTSNADGSVTITAAELKTGILGADEIDAYITSEGLNLPVASADNSLVSLGTSASNGTSISMSRTIFIELIPEQTAAAGYSVTASEDVSITAGENAEVSITVTEADSKAYNAYELNVSYPEGLTYVKAEGLDENFQANHDETNRTIQIIGYGADKASGTAAAKLTFTGSTVGEYDVTITSAKVDAADAAPSQDTPDATIVDNTAKITVTGYTVTLGEGLTADSTVANPGEGYTFTPTDADLYDYTITAKIGDTPITVTDNGDGTYTIPAEQITGNITITAEMTPKTFGVTIDGVKQETGATYKTDYVFTPEKEGYTVSGVTVTIGGEEYTGWTSSEGTYTIPGDAITGDIVITIDWTAVTPEVKTYTVTKSEGVIGADTATEGTDYTFSFGETDKYDYSGLKVMVGETDITAQLTENEDGSYTIPAALITGNITIEVTRTEKSTLTIDVVQYLTVDGGNMYLVTVKDVPEGSVAKYDGLTMYWSEKYEAYAWLVISTDTLENVKTAAAAVVTAAEGTADLTVDYSGDVNGTNKVDVNDAQLVYNMYNAYYGDFETVTMQKFLDADMNGDKTVNVSDAAAVVTVITGKQA